MARITSSKSPSSDIANSPCSMGRKIINYIRAGYPGLYLVSHEEQRVAVEMTQIAKELKYNLVFWSAVDGLVDIQKNSTTAANDPLEALIAIQEMKQKTLIVLRDFRLFLQDPNPILIRQLKDVLQMAKTKSKTLIILGCRMILPPELEREITVIEFALPGKEELRAVLGGIMESANIRDMDTEIQEKVTDAASGVTTIETENAFALSVVESKAIDPVIVAKEKAQAVKKNGLLELIETKENLDSIGGLDVLKEWLLKRRHGLRLLPDGCPRRTRACYFSSRVRSERTGTLGAKLRDCTIGAGNGGGRGSLRIEEVLLFRPRGTGSVHRRGTEHARPAGNHLNRNPGMFRR
jgi:hypothetical protein